MGTLFLEIAVLTGFRTLLQIGALLPCLLSAACTYSFTWVNEKRIADCTPEEIIEAAWKAYDLEDYDEAAHLASYIPENFPDRPEAEEALYLAGDSCFQIEEYWQSFKHFEELLKRYPVSQYVGDIAERDFLIGESFLNEPPGLFGHLFTNRSRGVRVMNHLVTNFSHHPLADDAQMAVADYYFDDEEYEDAAFNYKQLVKRYAASEWAEKATFRLGLSHLKSSKGYSYDRESLLKAWVSFSHYKSRYENGAFVSDASTLLARTRNISKYMSERLSPRLLGILKAIGAVAEENGCNAYVVGGFVRDLFLYRPNEDVDIVVEGDGIDFARKYALLNGARVHTHAKFGTAVITFPDGFKLDVASARMEYYKFPAALPTVEMSSIKLDLFRRDFTINTLAIQLSPSRFGTLIDFFGGQKDIKEKNIRVLHNLSFVEDPTRAFRAIRFEQRFGFSIGKLTAGLIENAVKMDFFSRLSGRRVFSELRLILEEENPTASILRLNDFGLLQVIDPRFEVDRELVALFNAVKKVLSWYDLLYLEEPILKWVVYFLALVHRTSPRNATEVCARFEIPPRFRSLFCEDRFPAEICLEELEQGLPRDPSRLFRKLSGFKTELILFMMAAARSDAVRRAVSTYITQLRHVRPAIKGEDLKALGIAPGPAYKRILEAVQDAKLNGVAKSRSDELALALRLAGEAEPEGLQSP